MEGACRNFCMPFSLLQYCYFRSDFKLPAECLTPVLAECLRAWGNILADPSTLHSFQWSGYLLSGEHRLRAYIFMQCGFWPFLVQPILGLLHPFIGEQNSLSVTALSQKLLKNKRCMRLCVGH